MQMVVRRMRHIAGRQHRLVGFKIFSIMKLAGHQRARLVPATSRTGKSSKWHIVLGRTPFSAPSPAPVAGIPTPTEEEAASIDSIRHTSRREKVIQFLRP